MGEAVEITDEHSSKEMGSSDLSRRKFMHGIAGVGAVSMLSPLSLLDARADDRISTRLSTLAYEGTEAQGEWNLTDIEGEIPRGLYGVLYRIGAGQKINHGKRLQHFFDGDALLAGFGFEDGKVRLRMKFIETAERQLESAQARMIWNEFGTLGQAPWPTRKLFKNQPNINVVPWDGGLIALSEAGPPARVNPKDFSFEGPYDFHGTLGKDMTFTAHPKIDPKTGDGFGFGLHRSLDASIRVYRMDGKSGKLAELYSLPQYKVFLVHDFIVTENHLVLLIPPVTFEIFEVLAGVKSMAGTMKYWDRGEMRIVILKKDGSSLPLEIKQPPCTVIHHGNGYEQDGRIIFDSFMSQGDSLLKTLKHYSAASLAPTATPSRFRYEVDLAKGQVVSRIEKSPAQEFPRFDLRKMGRLADFLYTLELDAIADPLGTIRLCKHNLRTDQIQRVEAGRGRIFGEPVFVPHSESSAESGAEPGTEDEGWILNLGFDAERGETFLDIRDARTLDLAAKVWTGKFLPLGFHGNFVAGATL